MKKFIQRYWIFLGFLALLLIPKIIIIVSNTNTEGIKISKNYNIMHCDESIKIFSAKSAYKYETEISRTESTDLKSHICSLNANFDNSKLDRAVLFSNSINRLEKSIINRPDIAQYFYYKIIQSNPDDSLSLYLKKEKIIDDNNQ